MNYDMTFCVAIDCPYRFTCKRHENNNTFEEGRLISMANFKHTDTKCDYYMK